MSKVHSSSRHGNGKGENAPNESSLHPVKTMKPVDPTLVSGPRQTFRMLQSTVNRGLTRPEEIPPKQKTMNQSVVNVYRDPPKKWQDEAIQTELTGGICARCNAQRTPVKVKPSASRGQGEEDEKEEKQAEEEVSEDEEDEDSEQVAHRLMVQEEPSPDYWKQLAERRREALNDSLKENEELVLKVAKLEEENEKLVDVASRAEEIELLLQSITEEPDPDNCNNQQAEESSTDDKPPTPGSSD